ncbi:proline iminopeptidase-family hydrolase [Flavobacterium sp. LC2016-01]|uniref:proline iminopeptidase-family hydrolase n=1 Tax=Flavobacterium sp. LC2016-01 TaxID=2675876 RepID=UPI001E645A4C|nr:proline iminopeptidase-family hydrolase [Flavobacterium sp. LC2016-01]
MTKLRSPKLSKGFLWQSMLLLTTVLLSSCSFSKHEKSNEINYFSHDSTQIQTGGVTMVPVSTPNGKYKVWTKRIGNNPKIKVLLLAGGPGFPHDYLEVFESFFPGEGIEFYYYDELGSGNSDKPNDTTRHSIARAVEEVEQVRKALGLNKDNFYLFGHSWGGLLAMEYAVKYQNNLKAMIVSNMSSSGKEFNRYVQQELTKQIEPQALDSINKLAEKNDYGNPKYMELVMKNFYSKFICRIPVENWPEPLNRALGKLNQPYYMKLQGPSEFGFIGSLKDWDVSQRLKEIYVPTLMIGAKYDEMDPEHMKWMSKQVKDGQYLYCAKGSHLSMYDEQPFYMKGVINFIKMVDQK